MSATNIEVITLQIQNPDFEDSSQPHWSELPSGITYQQESNWLTTLSTTSAPTDNDISGLLYFPTLSASQRAQCPDVNSTSLIPANITLRADLPVNYELIALTPWIPSSPNCTFAFLEAASNDLLAAMIVFQPGNETNLPAAADRSWSLGDGGAWKNKFNFPVYAVQGAVGAAYMKELAAYNGNATDVPMGHELLDSGLVQATDFVRLMADISTGGGGGLPSLWVFLLMVVAILIIIIAATSCLMHCIARRRRRTLRRRVIDGEVDLEALGIKRLRVPQEVLNKMPKYEFTGPPSSAAPTPAIEARDPIAVASPEGHYGTGSNPVAALPTTVYDQQTCAICLDDFVSASMIASHRSQEAKSSIAASDSKVSPQPDFNEASQDAPKSSSASIRSVRTARTTIADEPSVVRELPCGHIFHVACVDPFLIQHSSLCPLCKKSSLPTGYVPKTITNTMVRRERQVRTLRGRGILVRTGDSRDIVRSSVAGPDAHTYVTPMERMWTNRPRWALHLPDSWRSTNSRRSPGNDLSRQTPLQRYRESVALPVEMELVPTSGQPAAANDVLSEARQARHGGNQSRRPLWWRSTIRRIFPVA